MRSEPRSTQRTVGLGRRVLKGTGTLLLAAMVSCGTRPAERPDPTSAWLGPLRGMGATSVDGARYRGALFALRAGGSSIDEAVWVRCALEVPYRFEAIRPTTVEVDVPDMEATQRLLPASRGAVIPLVQAGTPVRVVYQIAGRFVLDAPSVRAASIVCASATHYVRSIAVGAYRVEVGAGKGDGPVVSGDVQGETHGRPSHCAGTRSSSPVEGCTVPLAYELESIPGHDPQAKLRAGDLAGPEHMPRSETMPGVRVRRQEGKTAGAGYADCAAGFEPSGDAGLDLGTLGSRCGGPTGMVPHSEVLAGWQAATGDVSRYTVPFEAGQCYRAFGVGGGGVQDLDMGWHDPRGSLVARDVRPDAWAIVPSEGPLCAPESGDFELMVSVERGQGPFAVQVWRVDR